MDNTIKIVSLGPGDPEMITLKGLQTLQKAHKIFCPVTRSKAGKEISRSAEILTALGIDKSNIESYYLPMSTNREKTLEIYKEVANSCIEHYNSGENVVITAEGDGGFYSSSHYIQDLVTKLGYRVERVAGVPAFIDCASLAGVHVASGERPLEVIPFVESAERILDRIKPSAKYRANLVLMKLSQSENIIKEAIREILKEENKEVNKEFCNTATFHYIENRGRADEFYTSNIETILERKFPYFSILIIEVK